MSKAEADCGPFVQQMAAQTAQDVWSHIPHGDTKYVWMIPMHQPLYLRFRALFRKMFRSVVLLGTLNCASGSPVPSCGYIHSLYCECVVFLVLRYAPHHKSH